MDRLSSPNLATGGFNPNRHEELDCQFRHLNNRHCCPVKSFTDRDQAGFSESRAWKAGTTLMRSQGVLELLLCRPINSILAVPPEITRSWGLLSRDNGTLTHNLSISRFFTIEWKFAEKQAGEAGMIYVIVGQSWRHQ